MVSTGGGPGACGCPVQPGADVRQSEGCHPILTVTDHKLAVSANNIGVGQSQRKKSKDWQSKEDLVRSAPRGPEIESYVAVGGVPGDESPDRHDEPRKNKQKNDWQKYCRDEWQVGRSHVIDEEQPSNNQSPFQDFDRIAVILKRCALQQRVAVNVSLPPHLGPG